MKVRVRLQRPARFTIPRVPTASLSASSALKAEGSLGIVASSGVRSDSSGVFVRLVENVRLSLSQKHFANEIS